METQVTNQEDHINHSPEPSMDEILESDDEPYTTGPVTMVGDYEYIGVLDLPALNLSLPIMSDWDYERLKMAPCRQFGSAATDDLVIAGHNYINHFGSLGMLKAGDSVTFTGTDGAVNTYVVSETATISPTETEKVTESGYPLVLCTCTYGRQSRIVIYCSRAESVENAPPSQMAERFCAILNQTMQVQLKGSGFVPHWMPVSSS